MSRIWSMMDVGRRSLANSQTALQTTAHNVANRSTEGYSRQRVDLVTNLPIGEGKLRIGMGANPRIAPGHRVGRRRRSGPVRVENISNRFGQFRYRKSVQDHAARGFRH